LGSKVVKLPSINIRAATSGGGEDVIEFQTCFETCEIFPQSFNQWDLKGEGGTREIETNLNLE
ncbi:hypothetical protein BgiBS90_029150, partial [Biomphalaria glabrata]